MFELIRAYLPAQTLVRFSERAYEKNL